jgi:hypothetical protein
VPRSRRAAQRGITREHEAILEGVYEARAWRERVLRASLAADTRVSLPPRQLERKPQPHTELRLAAQLDLDVLAVKASVSHRGLSRSGPDAHAPRSSGVVPLAPRAHAAHPPR